MFVENWTELAADVFQWKMAVVRPKQLPIEEQFVQKIIYFNG
jgi:hypothetical protein